METRNELNYNTSKIYTVAGIQYKLNVSIRLSDPCKNGICDFAITGMGYRKTKNGRWVEEFGGCCHEEILNHFPEFDLFVKLHNCNYLGQPVYTVENSMYYLELKQYETAAKYLRVSENELQQLTNAIEDKIFFTSELYGLGIVSRWKEEADQAIKVLEGLCGCQWVNPYKPEEERFKLAPLSNEELTLFNERVKIGYYKPEAVQARAEERKRAEIEKKRAEITSRYDKEVLKAETEKNIMLAVLDSGINPDNAIYYSHSNTLCFNWRTYGDKISQEDFITFVNTVDRSRLPEEINFQIK